jgi:hypothetical protein
VDPLCLLVAGVVRATLPAEFTLAWEHSVQKTRWEELYRVDDGRIVLAEARIQGSGAGMEAPAGAVLRDGWWVWQPMLRLDAVRPTLSRYAGDYRLCGDGQCSELRDLAGPAPDGAAVTIEPCARAAGDPPAR